MRGGRFRDRGRGRGSVRGKGRGPCRGAGRGSPATPGGQNPVTGSDGSGDNGAVRYRILGTTQVLRPDGTAVPLGGARLREIGRAHV